MLKTISTQYCVNYTNDIGDDKTAVFNDRDHVKVIFPRGHVDGYVVTASPANGTVTLEICDGIEYDIDLEQVVAISVFSDKAEKAIADWKNSRRTK